MALYTTPDGRVIIGTGVTDGNDYHGYNGKRDIVIQLTADGATTDGLNALEYLKSYAENAKADNKPIFPDGTRVFISANGYTKAVEADDVIIDGDNITIGGIVWNGSAWDYSGAGQVASSLPEVDSEDNGKVLTVVDGAWAAANGGGSGGLPTPTSDDIGKVATVVGETSKGAVIVPEQTSGGGNLSNANVALFTIGAVCVATYDGTDYVGTIAEVKGAPSLIIGEGPFPKISLIEGNLTLSIEDFDSHTISVNLASTSVAWGMASGGGVLVVTDTDGTLDKTWQEIHDAMLSGGAVVAATNPTRAMQVIGAEYDDRSGTYTLLVRNDLTYEASSASGYPEWQF